MLRPGHYIIREFINKGGVNSVRLWLNKIDGVNRARIQARFLRFESGNFGDTKILPKGIYEARFMFGPGFRVYFGIDQGKIVLLLTGGDKSTQASDIRNAQALWKEFKESQNG